MHDAALENRAHRDELRAAFERVLDSGRFILGDEVQGFEREAAQYLGVPFAVGVSNCSDALVLALRLLGVKPGDEVLVPDFTFIATAEAVLRVGAKVVLVDIDADTLCIDPLALEERISPRCVGIIPVHLFGLPAPMGRLRAIARAHGLWLLEDAAQAMGASLNGRQVGSMGELAVFSFFPTKPLAGLGDGGLLCGSDEGLDLQARALRQHGTSGKLVSSTMGYNARLDALQAAFLRVKLARLDARNDARIQQAGIYDRGLAQVQGLRLSARPLGARHVFHQYAIRLLDGARARVQQALWAAGIETRVYYPVPLHEMPPYRDSAPFPRASAAAAELLCLPLGPQVDEAAQQELMERLSDSI
jgi:dTDP-4-amino-4,6-dideoxygalactose transaminase